MTMYRRVWSDGPGPFLLLLFFVGNLPIPCQAGRVSEPSEPSAPSVVSVATTSAELTWDPPSSDNGTILQYRIRLRGLSSVNPVNDSFFEDVFILTDNTTINLTNLEPFSSYVTSVSAFNSIGEGNFSNETSFMTAAGAISPIVNVEAEALNSSIIKLTWSSPKIPNDQIVGYFISYWGILLSTGDGVTRGIALQQVIVSTDSPACQGNTSQNCTVHFAGLMAFTRYRFAVSGVGSNNTVAPEGIIAIADTLQSVPDPPQNLTLLEVDAFSASVQWTPALFPNGILQSYELQVTQNSSSTDSNGVFTIMVNGSLTNTTIAGLEANTLYTIRIRGFTIEFGDFSDPLSIQTPQAPVEFFEEFSDLMATNGSSVAFVCSVRGSKPITYQWLKDGTLLPLEDNSTLEINPVLFGDEGSYQCNASNIFNSIAADAILTVSPQGSVSITSMGSMTLGSDLTLLCSASGGPGNTFQWSHEGDLLMNATNDTLVFSGIVSTDQGVYTCKVNNSAGVGNATFTLAVSPEGNVSVIPDYLQANEMDSVNFTCETQGGPGNTYQWLRNEMVLPGETDPVLSLENVTISDEGRYACNVSNPGGSGISNTATLIITQPPIVEAFAISSTAISVSWDLASELEDRASVSYILMVTGLDSPNDINSTFSETQNFTTNETFLTVQGLVPFSNYSVVVVVVRNIGNQPSDITTVRTFAAEPSPPRNLIGGNTGIMSVVLQWLPPLNPNGIVNAYTVYYSQGASFNQSTASSLRFNSGMTTQPVTGLESNTWYTFTVAASNSADMSVFSNIVTIFVPNIGGNGSNNGIIPPSNPLNVMATPMPTAVNLTWEGPVFFENLTHYTARCISFRGNSDVATSTVGLEATITVEGLIPETMYTCYVISVAVGTQGGSESVGVITTTPDLMMPMNVTATATSPTTINVRWEPPPFVDTIDHYFVSWMPVGLPRGVFLGGGMEEIDCVSSNTPLPGRVNCTDVMEFDITGLEEHIEYQVMVLASNDVGNSTSGMDTERTLPDAPSAPPTNLINVSTEAFSVSIQWDIIDFLNQNGPNFVYNVSYSVEGDSGEESFTTVLPNATISGLKGSITYEIRVRGQNAIGLGPQSFVLTITTLEALSSEVLNLRYTEVTDTTIGLRWDAPECPNGPITHYIITYNGLTANTTNESTTFTLTDLEPFTNYTINVAAVNGVGVGNASNDITVQTAEGEPTPPRNLTGGNTGIMSAVLQWMPPADSNGIILYYVVHFSEGMTFQMDLSTSQHFPPDTTTQQISSLSSNTYYTFVVAANNSEQMSNFSNPLTVLIPSIGGNGGGNIIPPSNPLNVMATPMPTAVNLTWEGPVFSENLTHYTARCISFRGNSDVATSTVGLETTITVEGLIPETMYTCYVISVAVGTQGGSESVGVITTTPDLMMPMNVTATATSPTTINVRWEPPPFVDTIDHYFVSWMPVGLPRGVFLGGGMEEIDCVSSNTPLPGYVNCTDVMEFDITGLEEHIEYQVMVLASNDVGNSTSGMDTERTLPDAPSAPPTNLINVSTEAFSVSIQWDIIDFLNQNGPNFVYNVSYSVEGDSGEESFTTGLPTATISGLKGSITYEIRVRGQNAIGLGPQSAVLTTTTLEALSSEVLNLRYTEVTDATIGLRWDAPECPNGPITHYIITYNGLTVNTTNESTTFTLTDLEPFTNYTINVAAVNGVGVGNSSNDITVRTAEGEPTPPRNLTGGNTGIMSAVLQWMPPADSNGIILYYVVHFSEGMTFQMDLSTSQHFPPDTTTQQISSLSSNTYYTFVVAANNSEQMSNFSNPLTVLIPSIGGNGGGNIIPPSNPLNVMATQMPTAVNLTWEGPVFSENLTHYTARCISFQGNSDVAMSTVGLETTITVEGLIPETMYTCYVISVAVGTQGGSESVRVITTTPDLMMPMNVTATATSPTTINVRWEPPPFVDTIDHYFVSWMPVGLPRGVFLGGGMEEIDCVSSNTPLPGRVNCTDVMEFDITGLEEHIEYQVMVLASNDVGNSTSGMDTERTLPDAPSAPPTNLINVSTEAFSVSIQWDIIDFLNQNGPNFVYNVSYSVEGDSGEESFTTVLPNATISGLKGSITYEIRVRGQNAIELGPQSVVLTITTLEALSSEVLNLMYTEVTDTTIGLRWDAPECPNGPITHYIITYNGLTANTTNESTTFTLTDLEPFTNYTINVAAVNGVGVGNASNDITVQTAEGEPTPPRNLTGGNTGIMSAVLQWMPPADSNGIILYYVVHFSEGMTFQMDLSTSQHFPPDTTTQQISSLSSNTYYTFVVAANNSEQMSNFSNPLTVLIPSIGGNGGGNIIPPSNPLNVMATQMPTAVNLTWEGPVFSENLTHYTARCISFRGNSDVATSTVGLETTITVEGLIPETMYTCYVISVAVGTQGGSEYVGVITTTPDLMMPMNVTATATSPTTINVRWEPPPFVDTIDHYFVSWMPVGLPRGVFLGGGMEEIDCVSSNTPLPGRVNCTDVMEFDITGLEEHIEYQVMVLASNDVGNSTSGMDTERTLPDAPSAPPTNLINVSTEAFSVSIQWDIIDFLNQNGPNFVYNVSYSVEGNDQVLYFTTPSTNATISNLTAFTTYDITVSGVNDVGMGPSDALTIQTLQSNPLAPVNPLVVNKTSTTILVTWGPPLMPNGIILGYNVTYRGNVTPNAVGPAFAEEMSRIVTSTSVELSSLSPGSTYSIRVAAFTAVGEGQPSEDVQTATNEDVPSVPGNLTIRNVTSSSFDSSWTRPSYPNGVILSYQVTFTGIDTLNEVDDSFSDNSSINSTTEQLKVTGLVPFSSYAVYVVAFTSIGSGPLSDIVMIMTASSAPSAPRNLTSVNITTTSFAVTWAVPANPNGVVTTYNVEISTGGRVLQATNTSQTEFTFPQLDPVVKYTVSVCAYTLSCGSVATLTVETNGVRPQLSPLNAELSVNREDSVTLEFEEVRQAEPPIPRDNVTWTAVTSSGQLVLNCDNTTKYTFSSSCLSLTINNAQRTDGGSYTIKAVTRAGMGTSVISVSVIGVPPTITSVLENVDIVTGNSHSFVCVAVANPVPTFGWRFGDNRVEPTPSKYTISSNDTHSVLTVLNVMVSDGGIYECSAANRYGTDNVMGSITVLFPPELTAFPRSDRDIVLGESLVVSCTAEGRPQPEILWKRNGTLLTIGENVRISNFSSGRSELQITNFIESDSGPYTCTASNRLGNSLASFQVNLTVRANITEFTARIGPEIFNVKEGGRQYSSEEFQRLDMTCAASGIPPPTIVWLFDGTVLSNDSRRTIVGTSTHSNLTIGELQLSDGGRYRCRATSGNVSPIPGQTAITFELNVTPRDECLSSPCQNGGQCVDGVGNYTCNCVAAGLFVYSGRNCQNEEDTGIPPTFTTVPVEAKDNKLYGSVTLSCNAVGNPTPIITWFKDNQPLQWPQANGPTYTIDRIAPEDRGNYRCRASNVRGMVDSGEVQVLIEGIVQFRVEIITRTDRRKRQATANQTDLDALEILAIGRQLEGTGNVSAEIVSMVRIANSDNFIVTVNTNSTESPERLTQIVTEPLTEQFEEFSDIIQTISFNVQRTERHDGCPAETSDDCSNVGNIEWPETEIGVLVSIRCPCGPESENPLPESVAATRMCGGDYVEGARWTVPVCDMCRFTDNRLRLCELLQVESVELVANVLVNATSMANEIRSGDVGIVSSLLDRVSDEIGSNTSDTQDTGGMQILDDFLSTVDNIAEVDPTELRNSNDETGAVDRITTALDRVVDSIPLPENNTNGTQTVTLAFRNFAIQVVQPPQDNTTSFSPDVTSLLATANNMSESRSRGTEFTASALTLPPGLGSSGGRLALAVFLTASLYPPSDQSVVGSIVMSVSFPNLVVENLENPVIFTFPKSEAVRNTSDNQNLTCTFWDTDANNGRGDWNTRGCMLVNETEDNVTCQCNHLTSFSMLLDVLPGGGGPPLLPPEILEGLTYIGCILSVISLIITVITYLGDKKLREHLHRQLLISLSLALLGLYVTFLIDIAVSSYPEILPTIPGVCGTLSALLHYFFLVTFLCMGAIAINLYRKLVVVFNADIQSYLAIAVSISWVVPMFIVGFSIAPNYKYYTADPSIEGIASFCRAQSWPFYFGLILPFGVIYIFNMVMFVIIIVSLIRRPNVQKEGGKGGSLKRLKENFWVSVGLFVLFGASWVFGMLATAGLPVYLRLPFDIVFTILASTQGVWVFILYCLKSPECRKLWMDWLHCRFTQSARTTVSTSNPSRSKSTKGTRSTRINSIPRPSLVATLNRNIFNKFGRQKEDNMTSANYSSSVMSPPPFYQPPIELVHRDDPEGLSEKDAEFPFNGTGNDYFEKISFKDNISEHSFYYGITDTEELDKDCTVVVNKEAMLEEHSEQERYVTVKFKCDEEHNA